MTTDPAASGPASGAERHADPDRLADLAEGLLDGVAADEVRGHLASCERCAEDFALITLDSGLAGFLEPEPIPAEVVARVEAALYREPPLRDAAGSASAPSSSSSRQHVHHAARPTRSRRFKLAFGGLASVALLVGGTYAGLSMVSGHTGTSAKSSAAPASGMSEYSGPAPGAVPASPLAQLQQQATNLLASLKGGNGSAASSGQDRSDSSLRTPPLAAAACWRNPRPADTLLASAPTSYDGQPAELLVYAKPGDPAHAHVIVVPAVCATSAQSAPTPTSGSLVLSPSDPAPIPLAETDITRP